MFRNFVLAKPKGKRPTVFCPKCGHIFEARALDLRERCVRCGFAFTPSKGFASPIDSKTGKKRKGMYLCSNGHLHKIRDATNRLLHNRIKENEIWYPEKMEIYAIEYYCKRHGRGYKTSDKYDIELYDQARSYLYTMIEEYRKIGKNLLGTFIPAQEKPKAFSDRIRPYGYRYFWQMFNERQLSCLSLLLKEILKIENNEAKETLLMIFSSILEYNNMFCEYNYSKKMIFNMFSRHAYGYKVAPVENNLWGATDAKGKAVGTGSFSMFYLKTKEGLIFQTQPFERCEVGNKTIKISVEETIDGSLAQDFSELMTSSKNVLLYARDSQDLSFIDGQVDAIITDPPYYDNVMYAELADFFYVWLRLALKDYYKTFNPLYTPKGAEIVVNSKAGKTHENYIRMLTNVFDQCHKVLKDDGLMIFTYHHTKPETWAAILQSILTPGFYIVATYPIYSEMGVSTHIRTKGARLFDTVIVARKKSSLFSGPEPVQWEKLKDEIYITARNAIARVRKSHPNLTNGDIATIILGKCLEIYSKHYPNVFRGNKPLKVQEAFKDIRDIISELYATETVPLSDRITEFYLRHLAKKSSIEYNELLKIVQSSEFGTSIEELKNMKLLTSRGNYLIVVDPTSRGKWLSENQDPRRRKLESYIDAAHYLFYLFKEGKRLPALEELGDFSKAVMTSLLTYMASELKDDDYKKVLDLAKVAEKTPRGLERFMQ